MVSRLHGNNKEWVEDEKAMGKMAVSYFQWLFKYANSSVSVIDEVPEAIGKRVSEEMCTSLSRRFTNLEVLTAMSQISPYKSPSLDGMSVIFYQKFWSIIGHDITCCVTVIIPKCAHPNNLSPFSPISLCSVIYKISSKALANHIKIFLLALIFATNFFCFGSPYN